jgi:hypothetical protein
MDAKTGSQYPHEGVEFIDNETLKKLYRAQVQFIEANGGMVGMMQGGRMAKEGAAPKRAKIQKEGVEALAESFCEDLKALHADRGHVLIF